MKDSNTQYILIGLIILAGLLFIVSRSNNDSSPFIDTEQEHVDTEDENMDGEPSHLDEGLELGNHPQNNLDGSDTSYVAPVTGKNEAPQYAYHAPTTKMTPAQPVFNHLTLGTYFLPNIQRKGIANCNPKKIGEEEINKELSDYDFKNFKIEKIIFKNNQAYIYGDAQSIPEEVCAVVHQFTHPNTLFSGVHILVR